MGESDASSTTIEDWWKKSLELSNQSEDALHTAVTRAFEAMLTVLSKDSDYQKIRRVLVYLNTERSLALEFDNNPNESLHKLVHGLLESLTLMLSEWEEERNRVDETEEIEHIDTGSLAKVENWKIKSSQLARQEGDALFTAITRAFEAIAAFITKDCSHEKIRRALVYLKVDLDLSLEFEKAKDDSLRELVHGFLESLYLFLNEWAEAVRRAIETGDVDEEPTQFMVGPKDEPVDMSQTNPCDNQTPILNLTEDDYKFIKEETHIGKLEEFDQPSIPNFPNLPLKDELMDTNQTDINQLSDFFGDEMDFKEEETPIDDVNSRMDGMESDIDMDNLRTKKSKKDDRSVLRKTKLNNSEMDCPECEYRTRTLRSFIEHLKRSHSTNLFLAGLAFLCECGVESHSSFHSFQCDIAQFTVIRKISGPIRRFDDEKETPQCFLCEVYPKTVGGYARHLGRYHGSTLAQNEMFLLCSCGLNVTNRSVRADHNGECNGRQFTLHKLDDE